MSRARPNDRRPAEIPAPEAAPGNGSDWPDDETSAPAASAYPRAAAPAEASGVPAPEPARGGGGVRRVLPFLLLFAAAWGLTAPHSHDEPWREEVEMLTNFMPGVGYDGAFSDIFRAYNPTHHPLYAAALRVLAPVLALDAAAPHPEPDAAAPVPAGPRAKPKPSEPVPAAAFTREPVPALEPSPAVVAVPAETGVAGLPRARAVTRMAFALAACLVFAAARRLAGVRAGWIAAALFAGSHVALNFATQLRGYGFAWLPVALGLWATARRITASAADRRGRAGAAAVYALSMASAVAVSPENLAVAGALGGWMFGWTAWNALRRAAATPVERTRADAGGPSENEPFARPAWGAAAWWLATPVLGLLAYGHVAPGVWLAVTKPYSGWSAGDVIRAWFDALFVDAWAVAPLALAGAFLLLKDRRAVVFGVTACLGPVLFLMMVPATPRPFALVPWMPLWALAAGWAVGALADRTGRRARTPVAVALAAGVFLCAAWREMDNAGYAVRHPDPARPMGLYDQYFRQAFHPSAAARGLLERLDALPEGVPATVLLDDEADGPAFLWALRRERPSGLPARVKLWRIPGERVPEPLERAGRYELTVTYDADRCEEFIRRLNGAELPFPPWLRPRAVVDGGFHRAYTWADTRTPAQLEADRRARLANPSTEEGTPAREYWLKPGQTLADLVAELPETENVFYVAQEMPDGQIIRRLMRRAEPEPEMHVPKPGPGAPYAPFGVTAE